MSPEARRRIVARRLGTLRDLAADRGAAGIALASRATVAWATAGGQHHVVTAASTGVGALVVSPTGAWFVAPNIETARLRDEELAGLGIEIAAFPWHVPTGLDEVVQRLLGPGHVLRDDDVADDLRAWRSVLDPEDEERMAALGALATAVLDDALAATTVGDREDDLAAAIQGRLPGVRTPVVLVAADDRIARYRHPLPGRAPIRRRVMAVLVAECWGLHVAVTRFREFEPPDDALRRRIAAVDRVLEAMVDATRPGSTLGDVFVAAQSAYAAEGFPDEWQDHHQGGTIAYEGRETVARPGDPTVIEVGQAFAWNPSIAGAKAEDTFILGADGRPRFVTR